MSDFNFQHEPLLPYFLGMHKMQRHLLPLEDAITRWRAGMDNDRFGRYAGEDHDWDDRLKEMYQRQMWQQYNSRPGTQMGVNGNFPSQPRQPSQGYQWQMPVIGRRG